MSNIFEALEQAQRERIGKEVLLIEEQSSVARIARSTRHATRSGRMVDEMEIATLFRLIDMMLTEQPHKVIQFVGAQAGEGVSTIVREVADVAAVKMGQRVLVFDAAHHNPVQRLFYQPDVSGDLRKFSKCGETFEKVCYPTDHPNLCISSLQTDIAQNPFFIDVRAYTEFIEECRKRFDLVLVDSSPITASPDSVALARYVDGVILVLEAERTQWGEAKTVTERIVKNGGNLLGVVFNKYRAHIPGFLSRLIC